MVTNKGDNRDLLWLEIPTVANNDLGRLYSGKHYTSQRHTSWILRELAVHNLTHDVTIVSKHEEWIPECGLYWLVKSGEILQVIYGRTIGKNFPRTTERSGMQTF